MNSSGKLIGMNTSIYSPSGASAGIGFAIPIDVSKNMHIHEKDLKSTYLTQYFENTVC